MNIYNHIRRGTKCPRSKNAAGFHFVLNIFVGWAVSQVIGLLGISSKSFSMPMMSLVRAS